LVPQNLVETLKGLSFAQARVVAQALE